MKNTFLMTTSLYIIFMILSCPVYAKENKKNEAWKNQLKEKILQNLNAHISEEMHIIEDIYRIEHLEKLTPDTIMAKFYHQGKLNAYIDFSNELNESLFD